MTAPSEPDLTSLHVRRAREHDAASVEWIIERFTPLLLLAAERRLGPHLKRHYDADDVVSELWVATLPHLGDLEARDGRFTPVLLRYLSTALVSRINNLARAFARDRRRTRSDASDVAPMEPAAEITGAVSRVVRDERHRRLREVLEEMPELDREILILRGIEQGANQEVAERLGLAPGTAAVRYHRALERIRDRLHDPVFEDLLIG